MFSWLFGSKTPEKKTYPLLKSSMIQPVDAPMGSAEAKRVFREWMLKIGYLDKQEIGEHVKYFSDDMRERELALKEDLKSAKEDLVETVREHKGAVASLKKQVTGCKDPDQLEYLQEELQDAQDNLALQLADSDSLVLEAKNALTAFQLDKRDFLIEYVNQQTQR